MELGFEFEFEFELELELELELERERDSLRASTTFRSISRFALPSIHHNNSPLL